MSSQKQSHRVRKMIKRNELAEQEYMEIIYQKQEVITELQNQNMRLVRRLRHYKNRPKWWEFRKRWEGRAQRWLV